MYEKRTLPNGVRILAERMEGVRSAAVGIFVGGGSRDESPAESGAAHFIEHMSFKGTAARTAAQIAEQTDAMGGQMNAYTTKEATCFYLRVLDTHLAQAFDILWDMVYCSAFEESAVVTERGVILEEIGMYEDTPDDLVSERLFAAVFKGSALARPILGRRATLSKFTGASLRAYHDAHYRPAQTVVSVAGSFSDAFLDALEARFSQLAPVPGIACRPARYAPAFTVRRKAIEQNHFTVAFPGLPYGDERRFALQLLSAMLGGGASSRLFQQMREQRGLCYSVYSYGAGHADTGLFAVYAALSAEAEDEALGAIRRIVCDFAEHGPQGAELDRAREQGKANVLMDLESTGARMSHMGRSELLTGRVLSAGEIIAAYDAVTAQEVRTLAQALFSFSQVSLSAVGRVRPAEEYRALLAE